MDEGRSIRNDTVGSLAPGNLAKAERSASSLRRNKIVGVETHHSIGVLGPNVKGCV